jgi:predicted ATPase
VLLDNFEHLLAAAPEVSTLLAASRGLRVLVTSRAPLHVSGEHEYRLDPLAPDEAAALFVERARAVGREVAPDRTVKAICLRVDGLPLAVELAAARSKLLAPERLLERLERALPLLTSGARDAPERQRTLRATIEWSYDLLDETAKELFSRLSVFAGSFPLEAAEAACDADLDTIAALVDSSLLKPIGEDRFLMLETIREYAHEKLSESGHADQVGQRHAEFFAALAEEAYAARSAAEATWAARLELDHDDLRAALDWLTTNDDVRTLDLAGALGWFWLSHGHLLEGRGRLSAALDASSRPGPSLARALTAAGALTARCGGSDEGRRLVEEGVDLWRDLGDRDELASALDSLGWLLVYDAGDDPASLTAFEQERELCRELGDAEGEIRALVGVAQLHVALGEVGLAEAESRELLERGAGDRRTVHFGYHFLADCALIRGDTEEAEKRYRQSLEAALPLGDLIETSFEVQGVAMAAAGSGEPKRALRLAGSVEALWESLGASISVAFWDALLERYIGAAREALGAEADTLWNEGRALPFDDAIALALAPAETGAG